MHRTNPESARRRQLAIGGGLALLAMPWLARAADAFPSRPVSLVCPYTPGSGSDLTARAIAPFLKEALGQPVIVENRAGAGGAIGARAVAKAAPDGYTVLLGSVSFSVEPALLPVGYDAERDYAPIGMLGVQQMALLVPASFEAKTIADFVRLAKASPGRLNYGSAGIGSIGHLQMELLAMKAGIQIVHIPFSGTPQVLTEIIAGRVQAGIVAVPTALPLIRAGKVRALAVEGAARAPELPEVPTMDKAGYPELRDGVWYMLLVPRATPPAVVATLGRALGHALESPEAKSALQLAGVVAAPGGDPQEAARYLAVQVAKWRQVVHDAHLPVQAR